MRLYITLLSLFLASALFAQKSGKSEEDFGYVTMEDLQMTHYELDSSAEAVILYDKGYIGFDRNRLKFFLSYHTRIKILDPEAFEFADVDIPFIGRRGLEDFKGATHNLINGELGSELLDESAITDDRLVKKIKVRKVSFPGVVVGSIIEYTYKQYADSPFAFLPWYFQKGIPVRKSELILSAPPGIRLLSRLYGSVKPSKRFTGFGAYHRFVMDSVPAFVEEPYVNLLDDYYSKVTFHYVNSYTDTWEELIDLILEMKGFGTTLERFNVFKKIYPTDRNWREDEVSLKDIHAYVADHFEWNEQNGLIFSGKPKAIWESGMGSSADINLTLLMFLRKAGFSADPVFLSTTANGLINFDLPTFGQFDYLVVRADLGDKQVLLDATSRLRPYNVLPRYCINDKGLLVKNDSVQWVNMNLNKERLVQSLTAMYELDEFDEIKGEGNVTTLGSAASSIRIDAVDLSNEEMVEDFKQNFSDLELDSVNYSGLDDAYSNTSVKFNFSTENFVETVGSRLFITPLLFREVQENPFKQEERRLPIDFSIPISKRYFFNFKIPDGYEVEEIPESTNFTLPENAASYSYQIASTESGIQVLIRFAINRTFFWPEEYLNIKELFNLILSKQEQRIVLKPIDSGQ